MKKSINNNLLSFDQKIVKSILSKENNVVITSKQQLIDFVIDASSNKNLHLGIISNKTINRIKMKITDIKKENIFPTLNEFKNSLSRTS